MGKLLYAVMTFDHVVHEPRPRCWYAVNILQDVSDRWHTRSNQSNHDDGHAHEAQWHLEGRRRVRKSRRKHRSRDQYSGGPNFEMESAPLMDCRKVPLKFPLPYWRNQLTFTAWHMYVQWWCCFKFFSYWKLWWGLSSTRMVIVQPRSLRRPRLNCTSNPSREAHSLWEVY